MPRSRKSGKRKIQRSLWRSGAVIDALEQRCMLTTLIGGGYATGSTTPIARSFDYEDSGGNFGRVTVAGNVKVELIGYGFDANGNAIPVDLFPAIYPLGTPPPNAIDLFQIYVAQGDINGYVTVEQVDKTTAKTTPFGGPSPFVAQYANLFPTEPPLTAVAQGSGSLVLGELTRPIVPGGIIAPIISMDSKGVAFGLRPGGLDDLPGDPGADLSAGLIVAPGQSLGTFMFDGEVMGKVSVPGNMNLFYAGWLLTGDARGATQGFAGFNDGLPTSLADGGPVPRANFFVGGDLRNLVSNGPIGWDGAFATTPDTPHYLAGTDIEVGGRLGEVFGLAGNGGTVRVENGAGVVGTGAIQKELEGLGVGGFNLPKAVTSNDTFATAQYLGTFTSSLGQDEIQLQGHLNAASSPADPLDFYAVGLMSGQTVTVQLQSGFLNPSTGQLITPGFSFVGVMNPDGLLIASDYNKGRHPELVVNQPFQFTADRPGAYRIVVGQQGDIDFVGTPSTLGPNDYILTIANVGPIALGGDVTQGPRLDNNAGAEAVRVDRGDLGGIDSPDYHLTTLKVISAPPPVPGPPPIVTGLTWGISVIEGNLRSFDCGRIGITDASNITFDSGPDLNVPNGSVGLVRSRTGILLLNPSGQQTQPVSSVHGDYQVVDAATLFDGAIIADGRIGVIRATTLGFGLGSTVITADADNKGFDGTIDLIDCTTLNGPQISHGPGGDVRYIRAVSVVLDPLFNKGNADTSRQIFNFGQSVTFTDDSGSTITLTPTGTTAPNPNFDPNNAANGPQTFAPRLSTQTYPIRSGGVVLMDVQVTGFSDINTGVVIGGNTGGTGGGTIAAAPSNAGLLVIGSSNAQGGAAEISRIEISGNAPAPVFTTVNKVTTLAEPRTLLPSQQLTLDITGNATVDVLYVGVTQETTTTDVPFSSVTAFGNATRISNTTGGEIVSVNAASIGDLFSKGTIGLAKTTSGAAVVPRETMTLGAGYPARGVATSMPVNPTGVGVRPGNSNPVGGVFPFPGLGTSDEPNLTLLATGTQNFGVAVNGDVVSIRSDQGLGNIVVNGVIGQLIANADHQDTPGVFEGINGVVWAVNASGTTSAATGSIAVGTILSVNIGEGILSSGSGRLSFAGLYADSSIASVTNQGLGSDIHGDIISGGTIGNINLNNGVIVDADIMTLDVGSTAGGTPQFSASREGNAIGFLIPRQGAPFFTKVAQIGSITITGGQGGIIGSFILATNIGPVNINGFGFFTSNEWGPFNGRLGQITVAGYGVRDDELGTGAIIDGINATGNGANLSTAAVSPTVRESEIAPADPVFKVAFDPFSGKELTSLLDIHAQLGTGAGIPVINGVTDTGVIEDVTVSSQHTMGTVTAQTIRGKVVSTTNSPADPTSPASASFPMSFSIANSIGNIIVRGLINGLRVVTGAIKKFQPASDVLALNMQVSGLINTIKIKGSLANNSTISATGPNGRIGTLSVAHDIVGTIHATNSINSIFVGGNMTGPGNDANGNPLPALLIDGRNRGGTLALGKMTIGGNFGAGSINITGSIGTITTNGSFGSAGSTFNVSGSFKQLNVGAVRGGTLADTLVVGGTMGKINVRGQIGAPVTVFGSFNQLTVTGLAAQAQNIINGAIFVGGTLGRADIFNGIVAANITATSNAKQINITSGSLAAGASISSVNQSIGILRIRNGNLFGNVHADSGSIKQIVVDGNVGDGVDPMTISTNALKLLSVGGSILSGATITINGPLGVLFVGGNLESGATVKAQSLASNQIQGQTLGSLVIG